MTMTCRLALLLVLAGPLGACATQSADLGGDAVVVAQPSYEILPELEIDPEASSTGLFMAAAGASHEGRLGDAARLFNRASELAEPGDSDYLRQQAFAAAVLGGEMELAVKLAPTDPQAEPYRLGRLVTAIDQLANGDGAQAYAILGGESFGAEFRAAAALLRPWAALESGNRELALQASASATGSTDPIIALNQAKVLEAAGQPGRAEALYKALAGQMPEINLFTNAYGGFLERQGRSKEALALYTDRLAASPEDRSLEISRARVAARRPAPSLPTPREGAAHALYTAGMIALNRRDPESAITFMRLSLHLDPERAEPLMSVGEFVEQSGDADGARRLYARVPSNSPDYPAAQAHIVMSYKKAGDLEGALQAAQRLAASMPREPAAQVLLAEVMTDNEDYDGSIRILDKVISGYRSKADWSVYFSRAVAHHKNGDWPAAEKDLQKALAAAPEQPDVLNYLGYTWADRGERLPEALAMIEKAADAQPDSGVILDSLGWVHFRLGNYPKALEVLERAVELYPSAADINDHLGDVYAKVGRTLEARFQWQRVLTLDPDPETRAKVETKIAETPEPAPIVAASLVPETLETAVP